MDVFSRLGFEKLTETVVGKRGSSGKAYSYGSIFASLFFSYLCGGECLEDINTLVGHFRQKAWYSILSPFRKSKTSDFFEANIRTFDAKHPYFCPKKSDVLQLPALHLYSLKKNFWKKTYISYTKNPRLPVFTGSFGCRIASFFLQKCTKKKQNA